MLMETDKQGKKLGAGENTWEEDGRLEEKLVPYRPGQVLVYLFAIHVFTMMMSFARA